MSKIKNLINTLNLNYLLKLFNKGQYVFYISIIERAIFFILFVLLARSLDNSQYGMIIAIFAFANIISVMFNLGLPINIQRASSSNKKNTNEQFINSLVIKFVSFCFLILISVIYYSYSNITSTFNFYLIVTSIFFYSINNLIQHFYYGLKLFKKILAPFIVSRSLFFIAISLFSLNIIELEILFIVFLTSSVIEFIFLISILILSQIISFNFCLNTILIKEILKSSLPIGFGLFCVMVYDKIDIILIEKYLSYSDVSFYAVAYSIYKLPQMISNSFLTPFFSDISKHINDKVIITDKIKNASIFLVLLSIVFIIIIQFGGELILKITYGMNYVNSFYYLRIIIIALPFLFLNNLTGTILNSHFKEKQVLYSTVVGMVINILINIILLNKIGLMAAVISTIITEMLIFFIQISFILKSKLISV